jgi:hypothetical protein
MARPIRPWHPEIATLADRIIEIARGAGAIDPHLANVEMDIRPDRDGADRADPTLDAPRARLRTHPAICVVPRDLAVHRPP